MHQRSQRDEIEIAELLAILARRKWQMLLVTCAVIAVAIAYLVTVTPVYESKMSFYVGEADRVPIEQTGLLVERLESTFGKDAQTRAGASAWVHRAAPVRSDRRLVEVVTRAFTSHDAYELAIRISSDVLKSHGDQLRSYTLPLERDLAELEQIAVMGRAALTEAGRKRSSLSDNQLAAIIYSVVELGQTQTRMAELRNKLGATNTSATRLVSQPIVSDRPESPKPALVLTIAVFAGGLLALISAFVAEGFARMRPRTATA